MGHYIMIPYGSWRNIKDKKGRIRGYLQELTYTMAFKKIYSFRITNEHLMKKVGFRCHRTAITKIMNQLKLEKIFKVSNQKSYFGGRHIRVRWISISEEMKSIINNTRSVK